MTSRRVGTIEIDHEMSDAVLPAKLKTVNLFPPDPFPQYRLSRRHVGAQFAPPLFHNRFIEDPRHGASVFVLTTTLPLCVPPRRGGKELDQKRPQRASSLERSSGSVSMDENDYGGA